MWLIFYKYLYSLDNFSRALVHAMVEILFRCGTEKQAVVVSLGGFAQDLTEGSAAEQKEVLMTLIISFPSVKSHGFFHNPPSQEKKLLFLDLKLFVLYK